MADLTPHGSRSVILTVAGWSTRPQTRAASCSEVPDAMGAKFTDYNPGQFLTLRIPSDQTGSVARCYSLSRRRRPTTSRRSPSSGPPTATGPTGSATTSRRVRRSRCSPSGVFTPHNIHVPLLLIAAGSGVTPVMSILKTALKTGTGPITFFYANRSENDVIFAAELRELLAANPVD